MRLKLALSYAGFVLLAGVLLLGAVWWFLLRGYPPSAALPEWSQFFRNLDPRNVGPRAFGSAAVLALGFLLVFGLAGGWVLAGAVLAPLHRVADITRRTGGDSLTHRIRLPGRRDEIRDLADAFDSMLDRLEAHDAEQRRFAANASHELRTPLAIMQTLLDVARADPDGTTADVLDRLHAVNSRAIDLTEAMLLLSRVEQGLLARERVDLSLLVEEAVETLLPLAEKSGVEIETTGSVVLAAGSPALLLQATTNLAHNAIVHNRSAGGTVWISTRADQETAVLVVENTGDPLAPASVATLTEPFQRGTQRVHTDQSGVGLGLAIVRRIVDIHGGSVVLTPRPGGGLRVEVRLSKTY